MKIKISVIIPFYDNFSLLQRAINSVQSQSYKNYELIIIYDNPENKENLKLLNSLKKKKIKILINNKNLGAGFSRNKGVRKARGEFIAFLDSDDKWKKNKLYIQYNHMKKNNKRIHNNNNKRRNQEYGYGGEEYLITQVEDYQ